MDIEEVKVYLDVMNARNEMQRMYMMILTRHLHRSVPDFDAEKILTHLYVLLENHPHNPGGPTALLEQAGREELKRLADDLESIIDEDQNADD